MEIEHKGSRITSTLFRLENRDIVKVSVWLESDWIQSNTYYNFSIEYKKFRHRIFEFKFISENSLDERFKEYISEQQLYEAYYNHWNKLNPIRRFAKMQLNSDIIIKDDIIEYQSTLNHKVY